MPFILFENTEKEVVIYPDFGHEALKGHADRIFRFMSELLDR